MNENKIFSFGPKSLFDDKELQKRLLDRKAKMVDDYRPKEADFADIYKKEEIEADLKEIENLELQWVRNQTEGELYIKNVSSVYEGVIADQIHSNAWFGENCETVATSRYDDIKNGVDVVSIFSENESKKYLGLGVDVTFASDKKVLEKKLESIKQCIRSATLPSLKYFQDPETGKHRKVFLPKVIIGSRLSSAEKLIQIWGSTSEDKNKKLAEHPVQSKIIMESIYQLKYFYDYAINLAEHTPEDDINHNRYKKIATEYGKMYNIFYDIYENKKELIESHANEISDDIVYETILNYTQDK